MIDTKAIATKITRTSNLFFDACHRSICVLLYYILICSFSYSFNVNDRLFLYETLTGHDHNVEQGHAKVLKFFYIYHIAQLLLETQIEDYRKNAVFPIIKY